MPRYMVQGSYDTESISGMVKNPSDRAVALRDMVASPGGTTVEALWVLEDAGFRAAIMHAVIAAYEKSKRLGEDPER